MSTKIYKSEVPKVKAIELKKWLLEKGLTQIKIAKKAGVSGQAISLFIKGHMVSSKVKKVFLEYGCPSELLDREAA